MPVFLFSDIESSTRLWSEYPGAMAAVISRHDDLLRGIVARFGGVVVRQTGDGVFAIFDGGAPFACALEIQKAVAQTDWGVIGELRVRLALHTGEAQVRDGDYLGLEVNRTARLLNAGWGGQILLTCEMARAATLPPLAKLLDLGNHVLKDLNAPQHIYQLQHPDLPRQTFPALKTLSAHPNNLPLQPTPFVGRETELQEVAAHLQTSHCRLVTLLGMDGAGKTRLAIQVAASQAEHYAHGVYFVPLAALSTVEAIVPAIAIALGLRFYERETPQIQLLNYLRDRTALLVLDNFEHLLGGVAVVDWLLGNAPRVKILATSRERLNLSQEWAYEIQGMRVPDSADVPDWETYSAVRLFLQSVLRVNPAFVLDESNRVCIVRLCALVAGLPLGIELAAGWLRSLSCAEVVSAMARYLDSLRATARDVPDRQRSLYTVFEYSWGLLTPTEQAALCRLALFEGSFHRRAAEAVLDDLPSSDVLAALTALVDKSLLYRRFSGAYLLHNLLRQYALEKLMQAPDVVAHARDQHCAYYANFLDEHSSLLQGSQQKQSLDEIAEYLGNITVAWHWALKRGRWDDIRRMLFSLRFFFNVRARVQEAIIFLDAALNAIQDAPETESRLLLMSELLAAKVQVGYPLQDRAVLESVAQQCWEVTQHLNSPMHLARAKSVLGLMAWLKSDYALAHSLFQEALTQFEACNAGRDVAGTIEFLGKVAWAEGDYFAARMYYQHGLDMWRALDNRMGQAGTLDNLGVVARELGDFEVAQSYFVESMQIYETLDAPVYLGYLANHMSSVYQARGDFAQAERYLQQALAIGRELGERRLVAYTLHDLAELLIAAGNDGDVPALLEESLSLFEFLAEPFGQILVHKVLGFYLLERGEFKPGHFHILRSLRYAGETQSSRLSSDILCGCAQFFDRNRRSAQAVTLLAFVLDHDIAPPIQAQKLWDDLQSRLDAGTFADAAARGRALTFDALLVGLRLE